MPDPWPFTTQPQVECDLPLWEPKWPRDRLLDRLSQIGSTAFNRGFRQQALTDTDRTFRFAEFCFQYVENPDDTIAQVVSSAWPVFGGLDPSGDKRPGNALVVVAQSPAGILMPCAIDYGAWRPEETALHLLRLEQRWHPQVWAVENNATQASYLALIETQARLSGVTPLPTLQGFLTGRNKADEVLGLPGLGVEFEHRQWMIYLPVNHGYTCERGPMVQGKAYACGWCALKEQLLSHPVGEADDLVMSLWFARSLATQVIGQTPWEEPYEEDSRLVFEDDEEEEDR